MADDLGADFLKGYFGMAERRQAQLENSERSQQFAQTMAAKQQEYQLQQQRLQEEIKQHAAEGDWRQAQTKHEQMLENHQKAADDWTKTLKGFDLQASGQAAPVDPKDLKYNGPTVPIPALGGMQVPSSNQYQTNQGQGAVNFGGGQFLRPTSPQERAQAAFGQTQAQDDIAAQAKATRAMSNINDMVKQFPDSDIAKNDEFRQQTYSHMAFGTPMERNENWDAFETKETNNWLNSQMSSDPDVRDAGKKRFSVAFPIIHKINTDRAGIGAAIGAHEKETEAARVTNDTADLHAKATALLPTNATDAQRSDAVNNAFVMVNKEREAAGKPKLHPDALRDVAGAMTKGIPVSPKKAPMFTLDPKTGKPVFNLPSSQ